MFFYSTAGRSFNYLEKFTFKVLTAIAVDCYAPKYLEIMYFGRRISNLMSWIGSQ